MDLLAMSVVFVYAILLIILRALKKFSQEHFHRICDLHEHISRYLLCDVSLQLFEYSLQQHLIVLDDN